MHLADDGLKGSRPMTVWYFGCCNFCDRKGVRYVANEENVYDMTSLVDRPILNYPHLCLKATLYELLKASWPRI